MAELELVVLKNILCSRLYQVPAALESCVFNERVFWLKFKNKMA